MSGLEAILRHQEQLRACRRCPDVAGPVITGDPVCSPLLLVGQAPGAREGPAGRPFAWTAGKTLFQWFRSIGLDEAGFRKSVYMAAVCRCFPGKNPTGGDRVPSAEEVSNCAGWLEAEIQLLRPRLIVPLGKLALSRFMAPSRLSEVIGKRYRIRFQGFETDIVPLPHPSGASTWHRTEPGKSLLRDALEAIRTHPAWQESAVPEPQDKDR